MKHLLLITLFLFGFMGVNAQDEISDIASRVVFIGIVQNGEVVGNGSGTIVDPSGVIYTNRHVVEDAEELVVFVLEDIRELPQPRYLARVEFVSTQIDFAIIQIDRDIDGNPLDPASLNLPFVPISTAEVQIGEEIRVYGYPAIGDGYMVVTSGEVVTIQNGTVGGERVPVWYRTDTEFSGGNSGGLAVNENGEFIGLPTWVVSEDRTAGKLGGILPITTVLAVTGGDVIVQEDRPQPETIEGDIQLTIVNESSVPVCGLFVSLTTATTWGENQLNPDEVFQPGSSITFTVNPNYYDVLLEDCNGQAVNDTRNLDLTSEPSTLTFSDEDIPTEQRDQLSQSVVAGGVAVTCTFDNNTVVFENGVEIVFDEMEAGVNFTVTALGVNNFDPVLAVLDTETRDGTCQDDTGSAAQYTANLPTVGSVGTSERNPQVNFNQNTGAQTADLSVIVGGYDNAAGQFVVILEGMTLEDTDGTGDIFAVRLTPNLLESGTDLNVYMIAYTNELDPLMYLANPGTMEPFVTDGGVTVQCDDAGNADNCYGVSEDLSAYNIIVQGNRSLSGGPLDAMLSIPLEGLSIDPNEDLYFNFVMTSFNQASTGPYAVVFHLGTR